MPSVLQALSSIDLTKLTVSLDLAHGTLHGSASLSGVDPKSLLGELGTVLAAVEHGLPSKPEDIAGAVAKGLGDLEKVLDIPELGLVTTTGGMLEELAGLLEKAAGLIGTDAGGMIDALLSEFGGELSSIEKTIEEVIGRLASVIPTELPAELRAPVQALTALAGGPPADAGALVLMLGPLALGVDHGALKGPIDHIAGFVAKIEAAGGDLGAAAITALGARVTALLARLAAPDADLAAAGAELTAIRAGLDALFISLGGAAARLGTDLAALDPGNLATELLGLVEPLVGSLVHRAIDDPEAMMVAPLRGVVTMIEGLDGAALTGLFTDALQRLNGAAAGIGLGEITAAIDTLFDAIIDQIERVPLRRMRDGLLSALIALDAKIRAFLGFSMPHELTDKLGTLEHAIENVDLSAITSRVAELKSTIQGAVDKFPIGAIKDEIGTLVGAVSGVIKDFTPALAQVAGELDDLAKQIDTIDLAGAGQTSIEAIQAIRQKVEALLQSSDIPDAAKSVIGLAAHELRQLDIKGSVTAPFEGALAKIDAGVILAPIEVGLGKVREVLHKVTPQALIDDLDAPFEALLAELAKLKPTALLGQLSDGFNALVDLLRKADPRVLVAPLEADFQKLVKKLRDAIDPTPLFKPLNDAYKKILGLVDAIDLGKLLGSVVGKLGDLSTRMSGAAQGAIASKAAGAAAPVLAAGGAFQLGDILRPLVALIAQVRDKITGLAESLLGDAHGLLLAPLAALARLAGGGGVAGDIAGAVGARRGLVDPFTPGPLADLRAALGALDATIAGLSVEGRASLGGGGSGLSIDVRWVGLGDAAAPVDAQLSRLHAATASTDLTRTLGGLSSAMSTGRLATLMSPDPSATAAQRISALLDLIDPTPLANELDQLGGRIQAKLMALKDDLVNAFLDLVYGLFQTFLPFTPQGLGKQLTAGMDRIRAELSVLDPSVFEAEIGHLLDGVLAGLNQFSPAALAADLGVLFDSVLAKLGTLDPAKLLGDLDPIAMVLADFEQLRPSIVLAPLVASTSDLTKAVEDLGNIQLGASVAVSANKVRDELEQIVQKVQEELDQLLEDLDGGNGGVGGSVSVTADASV